MNYRHRSRHLSLSHLLVQVELRIVVYWLEGKGGGGGGSCEKLRADTYASRRTRFIWSRLYVSICATIFEVVVRSILNESE